MTSTESKLLTLVVIGAATSLFLAVLATNNRESPYTPMGFFAGCYSNEIDRVMLEAKGHLSFNGMTAGSYKVLKPVGGKHGFLVEADGLVLEGGRGLPIRAAPGGGGFFWPINGNKLDIIFAPDVTITLTKLAGHC